MVDFVFFINMISEELADGLETHMWQWDVQDALVLQPSSAAASAI
jgi:hypothetical protein